jgi:xylulokinase
VEFSPRRLFDQICGLIRGLVGEAEGAIPRALAIAGATGNTLLADQEGEPLRACISWMDQRAAGEKPPLLPELDRKTLPEVVGWTWREAFPLVQLAWLRRHEGDLYRESHRACMNAEYVVHRLTGTWAIDHSSATPSFLQNQREACWHEPYLDLLGLLGRPTSRLLPSGAPISSLTAEAAAMTGLPSSLQVVSGSFDHPCAARAMGVLNDKSALLSCGTSWVILRPTTCRGAAIADQLLVDPFLRPHGPWAAMGSLSRLGVAVDRLVEGLGLGSVRELDRLAAGIEPGAGGLFLDPTSYVDQAPPRHLLARHDTARVARAVMEGVVFALRRRMGRGSSPVTGLAMIGGGAESPLWPQMVADILDVPVEVGAGRFACAAGAAILAAIGLGWFADESEACRALRTHGRRLEPHPARVRLYRSLAEEFDNRQWAPERTAEANKSSASGRQM